MLRSYLTVGLATCLALAASGAAQECSPPSSTFDLIQTRIFDHGCTQSYCHGENQVAGLDLRASHSYDSLLPENPTGPRTGEYFNFVEPGRPGDSSLWLTLAKKTLQLADVPGAAMPIGGAPLTHDELDGIRLWIMAGAPRNGIVDGVSTLIPPCPPAASDEVDGLPPPCAAGERNLLLPDLVAEPPRDVRVLYQRGHRIVSFTTAVGNKGQGPLVVQAASHPTGPGQSVDALQIIERPDGSKCTRPAGAIIYEFEGKKWAYTDLFRFELRKDDPFTGEAVVRRNKDYYCLLDTDPIRGWENYRHQFEAHCEDDVGRMGISVGYQDLYHRVHPGQWIDLDADPTTTVRPGTYYLVNIADPTDTLAETDDGLAENTGYVQVNVNLADISGGDSSPPGAESPGVDEPPRTPSVPDQPGRLARPTRAARPARAPRPTRAPRPARPVIGQSPTPPATAVSQPPTPTPQPTVRQVRERPRRPPQPTRVPRPTRPPRPLRPGEQPATTVAPSAPQHQTPTAARSTGVPAAPSATSCNDACAYGVSQVRMTWYDQTGLDLSLYVSKRSCPALTPAAGERVSVQMANWRATAHEPTTHRYTADLLLSSAASAAGDGSELHLKPIGDGLRITYEAAQQAPARASDATNFPVAFDLCLIIGDQAVTVGLACQPKSTGMLCHQL